MSNISFDISGKINPSFVDALFEIKSVADSLTIHFFVVGATARDFLLEHLYNVKSTRATKDIDLGVEVEDWEQFRKLTSSLLSTGKLCADREKQRFIFENAVRIDIVPFGPISGEDKKISWPPEHETIMTTSGFKEAYENSITVRLNSNPVLDVRLPTLSGLAIMKIISWNDKPSERKKDAEDLLFIMNNYERAGNEDRLFGQEANI